MADKKNKPGLSKQRPVSEARPLGTPSKSKGKSKGPSPRLVKAVEKAEAEHDAQANAARAAEVAEIEAVPPDATVFETERTDPAVIGDNDEPTSDVQADDESTEEVEIVSANVFTNGDDTTADLYDDPTPAPAEIDSTDENVLASTYDSIVESSVFDNHSPVNPATSQERKAMAFRQTAKQKPNAITFAALDENGNVRRGITVRVTRKQIQQGAEVPQEIGSLDELPLVASRKPFSQMSAEEKKAYRQSQPKLTPAERARKLREKADRLEAKEREQAARAAQQVPQGEPVNA